MRESNSASKASPDKTPNPENPEHFTGLRLGAAKDYAAGLPAVWSSVKHVFSEMDPLRGTVALLRLNQKRGFDCPGCAWPDPDDERSPVAEYCENGAKAIAEEATTKRLTPDFFAEHSVAELADLDDYQIGKKGRIAQPMFLPAGGTHYEPISWDAAFKKIAHHLHTLASPDEAVFYTSGRTSNEAAFLYQLFVREFGTNNLPDCSNMCHESSGVALNDSLGLGKGSVTLEDFSKAEVILILGQNPGTNHPRMLSALENAKANGCQIVSINPLQEAGLLGFKNPQKLKGAIGLNTPLTDLFLQVRINGDMALLKGVMKLLLEAERKKPGTVFDRDFIRDHTRGFEALEREIDRVDFAAVLEATGLEMSQIRALADLLTSRRRIIACWAMGLTQHRNAVATIQEVVNLLLLKGSIGKPGAGTCPVRGHSNVQGDRTMGIYEKPSEAFLDRIRDAFGFEPPRHHGWDVVDCIKAMHEGRGKVFIAMGGNFLSATPDTLFTAEALRRCNLTVHISTKLNRSHLIHGREALILPTLGRSDLDQLDGRPQFVTCENSMGVVQASRGSLTPISEDLLSEPTIVVRMAQATLANRSKVDWQTLGSDYDRIRDAIEKTIPGFENYNARVRHPGGFYLPNPNREGRFATPTGKAEFRVAPLSYPKIAADEFLMMTLRSHDQFNTTIYGLDDRYRGVYHERRVVFIHPDDAAALDLQSGDVVDLLNSTDGVERVARRFRIVPYSIPRRCLATYFPETNVLVPISSVAERSNTPVSKAVVLTLRKSAPEPQTTS
jgi:molybdopterin-dependent oxidoreductase alpha subunit